MKLRFFTRLATLALLVFTGLGVSAQEKVGTLRKIADSGVVAIGYHDHESSLPFTYVSAQGAPQGYSYDISLKIAEAIRRELNMPTLQIKPVPFTTQNRLSIIQNGTSNLTCGATTHTTEREKLVSFSNTIYIAGSRLMTRKDSGIKDFGDLTGKSVVTFAASTTEKILRKLNSDKAARINIVSSFDRGDTPLSILQAGQADAYMMDDVLLYGTISLAWHPEQWVVTGKPQSFEAYACILPKDDPAYKKVVDQEIARLMKSGEFEAIYRKWLLSPIPPKGVNLGVPMSEAMVELLKNPNDKPFD